MTGLDDWARARAPGLLERAEREAIAVLRDALVDAATGAPPAARPPKPARRRPAPVAAETGEALWAYGIVGEAPAGETPGVDPGFPVEAIEHDGLVALVSRVPLSEFGEEPLRENLNELSWLERVARAHEAVLERALEPGPLVPLRLCTIYSDEKAVRDMLAEEGGSLREALDALEGRSEWGVKLFVDGPALAAVAREQSAEIAELERELGSRSGGGAYMLRRRLERCVAEVSGHLAAELADDVHARLADWALDSVLNPAQNRELSGHEGEMLLNGAYLVDSSRTAELEAILQELENRHRALGARLELTGPWPPYNFVTRRTGARA